MEQELGIDERRFGVKSEFERYRMSDVLKYERLHVTPRKCFAWVVPWKDWDSKLVGEV